MIVGFVSAKITQETSTSVNTLNRLDNNMNIASINVAVTDLIVLVSSVYFLHADRAC